MIGIKDWLKVSIEIKPGKSHGKPPKRTNLDNSNIVRKLANDMLDMKISFLGLTSFITEMGAMNTIESNIPISRIINIDIVKSVFP